MTPTTEPKSNARVYFELFDGVPDEDWIRGVDIDFEIGGHAATDDTAFQLSVYGRESLDAENHLLYNRDIYRTAGDAWVPFSVTLWMSALLKCRCIVVKLEAKDIVPPSFTALENPTYADQVDLADDPPWGVRIKKAKVYASDLDRDVTAAGAIADIVEPFFTVAGAEDASELDQLYFKDIPCSRREALDNLMDITGQDYAVWEVGELTVTDPESGPIRVLRANEAQVRFNFSESIDETYNKVRVTFANEKGRPREVICERESPDLADGQVRANTITAPDSVKSEEEAKKVGDRYLRDHYRAIVAGSLQVTGEDSSAGDALLIRPGDRFTVSGPRKLRHKIKATHVSLDVLAWQADVQFSVGPWRFDRWLARLDAGAHARRR